MSILIKGMEMPKCCDDCNLESYCNLWICCRNEEERHSDCPLVELPPHGRLIDADALMKKGMPLSFSVQKWVQEVDIACAPTIIEAEGSET